MEIIFVFTATMLGFAIFFLAFLIKGGFDSDDTPRPRCGRCDGHRNRRPQRGSSDNLIQIQNDVQL